MQLITEKEALRLVDDDGTAAGQCLIREENGTGIIESVRVDEAYRGRGLAGQLTEAAVYEIMARGLQVAASCTYAKAWLDKHPEFPTADDAPTLPGDDASIFDKLTALEALARQDQGLRAALVATAGQEDPVGRFCDIAAGQGITMTPADIVNAGEVAYAETRRATNGGGENSPGLEGEDDAYEMFILAIK